MTIPPDSTAIAWFDELGKESVSVAGGKGANLGELTRAGFSVPPGFVVTAPAYLQAMEEAGVRADLGAGAARFEPGAGGDAAAAELQEMVHKAGIRETLGLAIVDAYNRLGDNLFVAVRSSATARGLGEHLVRRHERDVHERQGRRRAARPRRRLLGVALRRARLHVPASRKRSRASPRSPWWSNEWSTPAGPA